MNNYPTNKELAAKIDDLPDEIIKRLDDRYLKKDDADKKFVTRREGAVVVGLLTVLSLCIAVVAGISNLVSNLFNRG